MLEIVWFMLFYQYFLTFKYSFKAIAAVENGTAYVRQRMNIIFIIIKINKKKYKFD